MATKKLSTSEKNRKFWALTPEKQRVAVAKDVLSQIEKKTIKATKGEYFYIGKIKKDITDIPKKLDDLFSELNQQKATCEVCGIGSCFVSLVNLGNNVETKYFFEDFERIEQYDRIDDGIMRTLLRKIFTPSQLSLIEVAFEQDTSMDDMGVWDRSEEDFLILKQRACRFGERYKSDRTRLKAIMENIVKNKGEFIP